VQNYWRAARRLHERWSHVQRGFFWLGLAQLAIAAGHAGVALVLGGSLEGPVSIRKPILFGQSFGLVSLSLAFVFHDLGLPKRSVGVLGWLSIVLSGLEVVLASAQYWRKVPSHFNYATALDGAIAGTMTAGAIAFAIFLSAVTVLSWRRDLDREPPERRSFVYGVRLSLPLALFGLAAVGMIMLLNGGQAWRGWGFLWSSVAAFQLGRYNGQAAGLAGGGSMMTVHALGTHVFQLLPLAGWWAGRGATPEEYWRPRMTAVAGSYAIVMLVATAQAFWVRQPIREGGVLAAGMVVALAGLVVAVGALLRPTPTMTR
jgi:hypothetical protein